VFTHLHLHTEYSLLDGLSRINPLVQRAKELEMSSLAITDHGGMYGTVEFYSACREAGIRPIIGCELYVANGSRHDKSSTEKNPNHLTVLARNNVGYKNLMKLVTSSHLEGFYYKPRVDMELLEQHREGLIVLSGCPSAQLSRRLIDGDFEGAKTVAQWYKERFPEFYLEIQRHANLPFLDQMNEGLLRLRSELDIPLVATNDLHYVNREDAPYQDVMICIQTNTNIQDDKRLKMADDSYHLKSGQEMTELFADLPEAIDNTQRIAEMCQVSLDFSTLHLPQFQVSTKESPDEYLVRLCREGFERRLGAAATGDRERLEYELDVIAKTRYANYFLVVADIADFARRNGILFGVRGSAASSLALYCLNVTDINPMEYRLVFERFLNVERKEMPDIDIDFQDDRRDEAIQYVVDKYGHDHVAQIITFGTLGAKAAIRDVGRALALPYADVDRIARLIPNRLGITIDDAHQGSAEMREAYESDDTLRELVDTARKLEGVVRHASTHAAGVVISEDPLVEHVPLQRPVKSDEQGIAMTQYAMQPLAKLGLLKMDFLGLANLTILNMTRELVKRSRGVEIDIQKIPLDDKRTFDLLSSGETTGLFQLESPGMRRHIKELQPSNLGEIAAMIALYRPGPMEQISTFIDAKHGRVPPKYPHPALKEILEETYGVIVYQDQVLLVMRTFAGYTLGTADIVRKAMGKKIRELMAQERERFLEGAEGQGYERRVAAEIFDLIEPFAGYAFNKAHSVSYALVAYATAYLKANYPEEFMTSVLNAYMGNSGKVVAMAGECVRLGVPALLPDVNRSEVNFSLDVDAEGRRGIRFGLAAVKNVGAAAIAPLVEARHKDGPFTSVEDFCRRAGIAAVGKRALESLVRAGGLDALAPRGALSANVDQMVSLAQRESQLRDSGQSTMFDLFGQSVPTPLGALDLSGEAPISVSEQAAWERELLGVSLSGHSMADLALHAPADAILSKGQLEERKNNERVTLIAPVFGVRQRQTKEQKTFAIITLETFDGPVEVIAWPDNYEKTSSIWQEGVIVQVTGKVRRRGDELTVTCDAVSIYDLPVELAEPIEPTVEAPKVKEWTEPAQETAAGTVQPHKNGVAGESLVLSAPAATTNGNGGATVEPAASGSATSPTLASNGVGGTGQGQRQKVLINLSETDRPDEDARFLRGLLQLLLEFPGNDGVDLVILSQGKRWRLEMPIITTGYCPELRQLLIEKLGSQDAVSVQTAPL
jgi:DNA polymerase-3 subunit alpha